jgi:hypothetical protein
LLEVEGLSHDVAVAREKIFCGGIHSMETMHSWEVLDPVALTSAGPITAAFVAAGVKDFRSAAAYVSAIPYGRTVDLDVLGVIREQRGTCSTKHALLRRLAVEQDLRIALVIGIYCMNGRNTPGVGEVLESHGLDSLPEAHCFLRAGEMRVDVTRAMKQQPSEKITHFIHEEEISPDQIGDYKAALHRRFLRQWMKDTTAGTEYTLDEIWRIRENCIAALVERSEDRGVAQ